MQILEEYFWAKSKCNCEMIESDILICYDRIQ